MIFNRTSFNIFFKWLCCVATGIVVFNLFIIIASIFYFSLDYLKSYKLQIPIEISENYDTMNQDVSYYQKILDGKINAIASHLNINAKLLSQHLSDAAIFIMKDYIDNHNTGIVEIPIKNYDQKLLQLLQSENYIKYSWNSNLFLKNNSKFVDIAGLKGAINGSLIIMLIVILFTAPLGILTAIYLVEFAPKNRYTRILEVSIHNLTSVPSVIFGLVGLSIFINIMHIPRASALLCSLVISILILPMIIISSKNALLNVPRSIYNASFVLGANKIQTIFCQILPIALPEIVAGIIIAMLRALSETAPLILIGTMAFIANIPTSLLDPVSTISVQIYQWILFPENEFLSLASFAIILLMIVIVLMSSIINYFLSKKRRQYEKL